MRDCGLRGPFRYLAIYNLVRAKLDRERKQWMMGRRCLCKELVGQTWTGPGPREPVIPFSDCFSFGGRMEPVSGEGTFSVIDRMTRASSGLQSSRNFFFKE